jgi:GntR family transcriptional repressor for pyruvate dehydrogenase complex
MASQYDAEINLLKKRERMKIKSIKRTSAADEVFRILHEWILSDRLKPGDKLPSQDELARQFNVSRNTLREAIYKLTVMGLLTAKQGIGTVVNITTASSYITSLSDHLLLKPATVRDFIEARVIVEQAAVRLAGTRANSDDIEDLNDIIKQQIAAFNKGDVENFVELDSKFHMELARISGNNVLLKFLETTRELLHKFIAEVSHLPGAIESAINYHRKIVEFLSIKDNKKAVEKMRDHLYDVTKRIERNMEVDLNTKSLFLDK